jgi:NAD/NADP transhydrogenase beta subunit
MVEPISSVVCAGAVMVGAASRRYSRCRCAGVRRDASRVPVGAHGIALAIVVAMFAAGAADLGGTAVTTFALLSGEGVVAWIARRASFDGADAWLGSALRIFALGGIVSVSLAFAFASKPSIASTALAIAPVSPASLRAAHEGGLLRSSAGVIGLCIATLVLRSLAMRRPSGFAVRYPLNLAAAAVCTTAGYASLVCVPADATPLLLPLASAAAALAGAHVVTAVTDARWPVVALLLSGYAGCALAWVGASLENPALAVAGVMIAFSGATLCALERTAGQQAG